MIVLANGCFDGLHAGHVQHLRMAKLMGDKLIVALTDDRFVNKGKGRPFYTWEDRAYALMGLECVDEVIESGENGVAAIIRVRPHIYVKGCDWEKLPQMTLDALASVGAEIRFTGPRLAGTKKLSSGDLCEFA